MNASISMVEYTIIIDQCNALKQLTLPLFALCEHQSQAWIKEEGRGPITFIMAQCS